MTDTKHLPEGYTSIEAIKELERKYCDTDYQYTMSEIEDYRIVVGTHNKNFSNMKISPRIRISQKDQNECYNR